MEQINKLKEELDNYHQDVLYLKGNIDNISESIEKNNQILDDCQQNIINHQKALEILNYVQQSTQENLKETFETIVTYALRYIYDKELDFKLKFDRRGNLGTLDFGILSDEVTDILDLVDCEAGGIIDILALALRITLIESTQTSNFIVFDESFKHLSSEYRPKASLFLSELNKKLNKQIIMISHAQEFKDQGYNDIEIK